jgi:Terminase small subunit
VFLYRHALELSRCCSRKTRKAHIAALIKERTQKRLEAAKLEADEVILSAARVLRFDPRKLVDEKGKPKKLHELDDATALALHSVELDGKGIRKVRVDKSTAREQLMKHLGLFEKDNRQQPPGAVVLPPGLRTIEFEPIPKTPSVMNSQASPTGAAAAPP